MEIGYSRTVGDFDLGGYFVLSEKELATASDIKTVTSQDLYSQWEHRFSIKFIFLRTPCLRLLEMPIGLIKLREGQPSLFFAECILSIVAQK